MFAAPAKHLRHDALIEDHSGGRPTNDTKLPNLASENYSNCCSAKIVTIYDGAAMFGILIEQRTR